MPDEELIEHYTQGRIGRRVFVRRLIAGGLSVGAAVAYGNALAPAAAVGPRANARAAESLHRYHHDHVSHHKAPVAAVTAVTAPAAPATAVEVTARFTG